MHIRGQKVTAVVTTGGLVLYSNKIEGNGGVLMQVATQIMDSKNLAAEFTLDALRVSYLYDAILGLVFVLAWRKELNLEYPEVLLRFMSLQFKQIYTTILWKDDIMLDAPDFEICWKNAYQGWLSEIQSTNQRGTVMAKFGEKNKKKSTLKASQPLQNGNEQKTLESLESPPLPSPPSSPKSEVDSPQKSDPPSKEETEWQSMSPRERVLRLQQSKKKKEAKEPKESKEQAKKDQEKRVWIDGTYTKKDIKNLDRSKIQKQQCASNKYHSGSEEDDAIAAFVQSDDEEKQPSTFLTKWVGKLKNIIGDKVITRQDLGEVLNDFKQKLMQKNVAQQVAVQMSEAVGETLLRSKTKSFTTVHKTVHEAMREALRKILTPRSKIDLVVEVTKHREKMRPYVIVFIGVNGVGKSTNLAKVAYKLKSAKLSVMLAACDNFRAGAVEQIETHGRNLDIPVFQRGYKEEPATIAYEAIKDATRKRIDAVLVDTAGRMQDNAPLMKQLAHLVKINQPNLVVFIGEALVGNGAVDQITKFNKALEEQSTPLFKPQIDAILLSKFDTVDDKVGTALSLVYSTSKPILFVGVGQKYPHLKELNVSTVVQALLS